MAPCPEAVDCAYPRYKRKLERLKENIGAVDIKLTDEDLHELEGILSEVTIIGGRYPESLEELTGR